MNGSNNNASNSTTIVIVAIMGILVLIVQVRASVACCLSLAMTSSWSLRLVTCTAAIASMDLFGYNPIL